MGQAAAVQATDRFERKREAILDSATELLNTRGVKGLTLGLAADAVNLSTTSVTYYFKRKDDLAAACMLRGISTLMEIVTEALSRGTPREQLRALITLYLDRVRRAELGEAPPLPLLSDLRALNMPQRGEVAAAFMKLFRKLRTLFEAPELEWLSRGRRTARTHMLFEQLFWAAAWLPKYDPEDYVRIRDRMFDILADGLAAPDRTWSPQSMPDQRSDAERPPGAGPRHLPAGRHPADQPQRLQGGLGGQDLRRAQRDQGQLLSPQRRQG